MDTDMNDCIKCGLIGACFYLGDDGPYCSRCSENVSRDFYNELWLSLGGRWWFEPVEPQRDLL